jgi:ATP-dependent DNA ligase
MLLPVVPPIVPMLARLSREIPVDGYRYEPKWDGFRCIAFRDGLEVDLRSRHGRPFSRYFPELVAGFCALDEHQVVIDGEIYLPAGPGDPGLDFAALMARLHPAPTRVARLSAERPAVFVAFDLLAVGREDLRERPFAARRVALERVLNGDRHPILLTPSTDDPDEAARWFAGSAGGGIDGVMAKHESLPYEPGRRTMVKVKRSRSADCVVAGVRLMAADAGPVVSSLILGLHGTGGELRHVGVITAFPAPQRAALWADLAPLAVSIAEHPWRDGFIVSRSALGRLKGAAARWTPDLPLDWVPLRPERVVEVGFDQVDVDRMRHPARFVRWRPDRDALSCSLDQILPDPARIPAEATPW